MDVVMYAPYHEMNELYKSAKPESNLKLIRMRAGLSQRGLAELTKITGEDFMTTNDIITDRLIIRSTREADGDFCLSIWLDDEMGKYMIDPPQDKVDDATLNFAVGIETQEGWYPFVAISKDTGELIGACSVVPNEDNTHWDLGYSVHKKYWRQGYGTEMIQAMINFGYKNSGRKFTADVAQANEGSNAVLRKLGFYVEKEDSFKKRQTDIVYDSYVYRLDLE